MTSLWSFTPYPSGGTPPIHIPFFFEAAILSRMRSPMTSRSNCAKDNRTFRVKRPIEVVVLNCCVTDTKDAPLVSRISTILAKSASERVSRLVDDHRVDPSRRDVLKQLLQSGPIHRRAGEPTVIISRPQADPAFMPLAVDEGLAGFALRLQRIELLFEPFLGRFASVDPTADCSVPPPGSWYLHWPGSATRMHALACRDQRTGDQTNVPR